MSESVEFPATLAHLALSFQSLSLSISNCLSLYILVSWVCEWNWRCCGLTSTVPKPLIRFWFTKMLLKTSRSSYVSHFSLSRLGHFSRVLILFLFTLLPGYGAGLSAFALLWSIRVWQENPNHGPNSPDFRSICRQGFLFLPLHSSLSVGILVFVFFVCLLGIS